MRKRKVLSFILVLSLVLGSFGMAFAAPLSDMAGEESADAVSVLTELGVVEGYPDGTYKPGNIVTRAEMAVIAVRALGLADYATGTASFSDMAGHWSNPYVAYATSLGILAGYPDGTFKPDNTVSYDEAATMLVRALGYGDDSLVGTWPANYVTKAKTLGILDGIKAGAAGANRGDIAIMTYQTLDLSIGKTNKDGDWEATNLGTITEPIADTMLGRLGAEMYDPEDNAYDGTLDSEKRAGAEFVVTGSEDSVISLKNLQGALVTAYANSDNEIIAIKEVKSTFYTGEFSKVAGGDATTVQEKDEFGDYKVRADFDQVSKEDGVTVTFENGVAQDELVGESGVVADGEKYTIAVKISGNYITKIYSIAAWSIDDHFTFEDGDLEDDNIKGNDFDTNNDDEIDLNSFALFGASSLNDIEEGNVVYVYDDGEFVTRIEIGTEVVKGEVTKINSNAKEITVDGKVYEMWNNSAFTVGLEDEVELVLDYFGDVYEVDVIDGAVDAYAVILETDDGEPGLSGKDAVVKLFLADGTNKVFAVDDDLSLLNDDLEWTSYDGTEGAGTLVEYTLDKDGVIEELTAVGEVTVGDKKEITSRGYFDGKAIADDVLIFTYDDEKDDFDEEAYGVTTLDKVKGNEYTGVKYLQDADNKKITLMLIPGEGASDDEVYALTTGWFKTTASDTEYMGTFLVDGKEVEYELTTAGRTAVNTADGEYLYLLKFNASDQVTGLTKVTDGTGMDGKLLVAGAITAEFSNGVIEVNGVEYTVASDAVAYEWDGDEYDKVTINRSNLNAGNVLLYAYDKAEEVVDVILIVDADEAIDGADLAEDKDLIEAGTYEIPVANQTDQTTKTAWVQATVNDLIVNGTIATVTWNADTSKYDVALLLNTATGSASITVTEAV